MAKKNIMNFIIAQEYLKKIGGEYAIDLVKICERKRKGVTDEHIGKKMKNLKVTEIRTILNRLHFLGIATYQKSRNTKTGWYSYSWGIKIPRIVELILDEWKEELDKLEKKVEFEKNYVFFGCKTRVCESTPFEIAAEYQFKCPQCGNVMESVDNEKRLGGLRKRADLIRRESDEMKKLL